MAPKLQAPKCPRAKTTVTKRRRPKVTYPPRQTDTSLQRTGLLDITSIKVSPLIYTGSRNIKCSSYLCYYLLQPFLPRIHPEVFQFLDCRANVSCIDKICHNLDHSNRHDILKAKQTHVS